MKKFLLVALVLTSAFSVQAKTLICGSEYVKFGFNTMSEDLFVTGPQVKDVDVVKSGNEHGRVSVSYDPISDEFSGSGEDGCTQVSYQTSSNSKGVISMVETEDESGDEASYNCKWLVD